VGALWNERVVPFAVEVVATQRAPFEAFHLLVGDLDALAVVRVSSSACTVSPVQVVGAAMLLTLTLWLSSGRPRQFIERCDNSQCSILFHWDVPGGKWQNGDAEAGLVGEVENLQNRRCDGRRSQRPGAASRHPTNTVAIASAVEPGAAGLLPGTLATSYGPAASMAFWTSCAHATCCAV
jgi:hypothetical protein